MRLDEERAVAELAMVWASLEPHVGMDGPPFPAHVQVRIMDLAQLVASVPLVREAARAACAQPAWDHDGLTQGTLGELRPLIERTAAVGRRWREIFDALYATHGLDHAAVAAAHKEALRRTPWLGDECAVADILARLRDVSTIDLSHHGRLSGSVLLIADRGMKALRELDPVGIDPLLAECHEIRNAIAERITAHQQLTQVARTAELGSTLSWLERLHDRVVALRAGTVGELLGSADDPLRHVPVSHPLQNVARLVAATRLELASGSIRRHAVLRLTAFLERFERSSLIRRIEDLPAGGKAEAVVQETVDRFLFAEGLFPITHCVAGAGQIDTLFEQRDELVDAAERDSYPAILLELKQLVRPAPTSAGDLKTAIDQALGQAEHYRTHLAARPRWRNNEVRVVVVYAGEHRYRTTASNVTLVYVGTTPPSRGARPLEV